MLALTALDLGPFHQLVRPAVCMFVLLHRQELFCANSGWVAIPGGRKMVNAGKHIAIEILTLLCE